jgi:hypothetical protein
LNVLRMNRIIECVAKRAPPSVALTSDTNFGSLGVAVMPSSSVGGKLAAISLMAIGLSQVSPLQGRKNVSDDFSFLDQ